MFFWILFVIVALWFLVSLVAVLFSEEKLGAVGSVVAAFVVGAIVWISFSATTVDSRSVGIQTSFGRYTDTLENGFQFTAPWSSVEEFSTLTQYLKLNGDSKVPVNFAGGSGGSADVVVRWAISDDGAEDLWKQYRTFDNVRDQLVESESRNAFRTEFSKYTPIEAIDGAKLNDITTNVKAELSSTLSANGVKVVSVQVTNVKLGDRAQTALDRIVQANADTERATSEQEKAKIEAETARIRQETQTPENLTRYCLEVLNSWDVEKNGNPPTMLNCGLGGGQPPVIVGH